MHETSVFLPHFAFVAYFLNGDNKIDNDHALKKSWLAWNEKTVHLKYVHNSSLS